MMPSSPVAFWKYFDFISIGALSIVISYIVIVHRKRNGSILSTISQTVAHTPKSSLLFSLAMTVFFPIYYAYVYFWVGPHVDAPTIFYYLLLVSAICEMIFVWVPALQGRKNQIHSLAAGIVGIFMFIIPLLVLLFASNLNIAASTAINIYLIASLLMGLSLIIKELRKYTFSYEVVYCLIFLVCMSIVGHS